MIPLTITHTHTHMHTHNRPAHFAIHGYDVNLCNRTASKMQPIVDRESVISLHGAVEGDGKLNLVDAQGDHGALKVFWGC
jgi:hypothetical protein